MASVVLCSTVGGLGDYDCAVLPATVPLHCACVQSRRIDSRLHKQLCAPKCNAVGCAARSPSGVAVI